MLSIEKNRLDSNSRVFQAQMYNTHPHVRPQSHCTAPDQHGTRSGGRVGLQKEK